MVSLKKVSNGQKGLLWNIHQKNLYEMTKYYPDDMDENGNYHYGHFDAYFTDPARMAYFIYDDEALVGFAMLNPYSYINHQPDHVIAEFAVFPSYRKKHIAANAARIIFNLHPGKWEIKYHERNTGAKHLWEGITKQYHPMAHHISDEETVLEFSTGNESSVRVSGGEFPYIRFGTGKKDLVMIAGMSMTGLTGIGPAVAEMYRDYAEEYTVYVFDRLRVLPDDASVRSMAQDTAEAMRLLGIEKADVMGASQGGMIALVLAIDHPELVRALMLCSACCYSNDVGKETFSVWSALADRMDGNGIYRDFFARVYTEPNETALALCLDTCTAEQCRRFGILARACDNFDCRDELSKVQCPVLVLGSAQDRVLGGASSAELARRLGCESFIYQDYGHAVYDEAPDFRQRMLNFLHNQ